MDIRPAFFNRIIEKIDPLNTSAGCPECAGERQKVLLAGLPDEDKTYVNRIHLDSEFTRKHEGRLNERLQDYATFNRKYVIAYADEEGENRCVFEGDICHNLVAINKTNGKVVFITDLGYFEFYKGSFESNEIEIHEYQRCESGGRGTGGDCLPSKVLRKYQVLPNDTVVEIKVI